jgi:hypothetical protein
MAYLIKATGEITQVRPANGEGFTLDELQGFVGGYIEVIDSSKLRRSQLVEDPITDESELWLNENGKLQNLPINQIATMLYTYGDHDPIVGDVLLAKVGWRTNKEGERNDYHF